MPIPQVLGALNTIAGAGQVAKSSFDLVTSFFPAVIITYRVTAQGGPATSVRTTLHLALATAFGMMLTKRGGVVVISAGVDHRNNRVEIELVVNTNDIQGLLPNKPNQPPQQTTPPLTTSKGFIQDTIDDLKKIKGNLVDGAIAAAKTQIRIANPLAGLIIDGAAAAIKGTVPPVDKVLDGDLNNAPDVTGDPAMIRSTNKTPLRGMQTGTDIVSNLARWLRKRNHAIAFNPALGNLNDAVANQEKANFLIRQMGPHLLYEIGKDEIYSGTAPFVIKLPDDGNVGGFVLPKQIQPFRNMVVRHNLFTKADPNNPGKRIPDRVNSNPILTRADDYNPQYPSANGLDIRSLVSQVLHDPGVWPASPQTDAGPPTTVNMPP